MKGKFINIVDFVNHDFVIFPTAKALRNYIKSTGKILRLRAAKENQLLRALLIHVF